MGGGSLTLGVCSRVWRFGCLNIDKNRKYLQFANFLPLFRRMGPYSPLPGESHHEVTTPTNPEKTLNSNILKLKRGSLRRIWLPPLLFWEWPIRVFNIETSKNTPGLFANRKIKNPRDWSAEAAPCFRCQFLDMEVPNFNFKTARDLEDGICGSRKSVSPL